MDKLEAVIEALILSTESGETIWKEKLSIFDSDMRKGFFTQIDSNTRIETNIESDNLGNVKTSGMLTIWNSDIKNGFKVISNKRVNELQTNLHLKYGHLLIPDKTDDVLDNILNKIGKVGIRDSKIESLLNKNEISKSKNLLDRVLNNFKNI